MHRTFELRSTSSGDDSDCSKGDTRVLALVRHTRLVALSHPRKPPFIYVCPIPHATFSLLNTPCILETHPQFSDRRLPNRICRPGCKSSEGVTRVCDSSCSGDNPLLHTRGCNDDTFGVNCRTCYTSMAAAKHAESFGTEAIMCDTLEYASADGSFSHTGSNRQQNRRWLSVV